MLKSLSAKMDAFLVFLSLKIIDLKTDFFNFIQKRPMQIFPWKEDYLIYVDKIDRQHQRLVEILNNLASAMSQGKGKDVLGETLNELIDYTVYHFSEEEKYFDQINYPGAEKHRKEHQLLIEDVLKFKTSYEAGKVGLTIELMKYLKNWVINHINNIDKEFGRYLRDSKVRG